MKNFNKSESLQIIALKTQLFNLAQQYKQIRQDILFSVKRINNIAPLRITKNAIDTNKNLQTYRPTVEDLEFLAAAKLECENWIAEFSALPEEQRNARQADLKIVKRWHIYYRVLTSNCERSREINDVSKATLNIAANLGDNRALSHDEQIIANSYLNALQYVVSAQLHQTLPIEDIRDGLTLAEMQAILGDMENANTVGALVFIDNTPTILIAENTPNVDATRLHEMQHLIQYLLDPESMPAPINSIDEITPDYLSDFYPDLPHANLSLSSTLEEIQNAFDVSGLENGPRDMLRLINKDWADFAQQKLLLFFKEQEAIVIRLNIKYKA
jgi:hypothetical protein